LLASSEDHKAVGDGDRGPNTGGMGTVSPSALIDGALARTILETLFVPTLRALTASGRPFQGILYGGLMLTPDRGPMVIEWNCRLGDPETQSVLMRLDEDLLPWLAGAAAGAMPPGDPAVKPGVAVCVVLASAGYPATPRLGAAITGLPDPADDLMIFHAGTRATDGQLLTAGGRVLGVTATGADPTAARERAYRAIAQIHFDGMHFRRDIGLRGTKSA
jgi:phosphoribosylamine--glycine ligase